MMLVEPRDVSGVSSGVVAGVDVGALPEQPVQELPIAHRNRHQKRRHHVFVSGVNHPAAHQQELSNLLQRILICAPGVAD